MTAPTITAYRDYIAIKRHGSKSYVPVVEIGPKRSRLRRAFHRASDAVDYAARVKARALKLTKEHNGAA